MASLKKELKGVIARFDSAQEAFLADANKAKKHKKKLKKAKAKIKGLEQRVASLEQELKVAREQNEAPTVNASAEGNVPKEKRSTKAPKSASTRGSKAKTSPAPEQEVTQAEVAEAVSDAPESVSEAAAEKTTTPKPRRGRPRKNSTTAKSGRRSKSTGTKSTGTKSTDGNKTKTTRRRGRPSTKPAPSVLTQINGVGATMAKRFEEAGVTTINQFSKLSDTKMKEVLEQCGPRYRNADSDKMEKYRENARAAMAS